TTGTGPTVASRETQPSKVQPRHEGHGRSDQRRDLLIHGTNLGVPVRAVESVTEFVDGSRGKDMRLANLRKVVGCAILRRPIRVAAETKPGRRIEDIAKVQVIFIR